MESEFIYATLLPVDMVPFGYLRLRLVVLPMVRKKGLLKLYDSNEAHEAGFVHLTKWLDIAEKEWTERRGAKAGFMSCLERLNYKKLLVRQNVHARFRAIYAMSGTHVCASAVRESSLAKWEDKGVRPNGFAADYTTYYIESTLRRETCYLVSVLNAACVNKAIKGAQAKGLWGARHVCKKVLDLPIPIFEEGAKKHVRLAEIGEECAGKVEQWIEADGPGNIKSIGVLRRKVRELLADELAEIDSIVKPMLGL